MDTNLISGQVAAKAAKLARTLYGIRHMTADLWAVADSSGRRYHTVVTTNADLRNWTCTCRWGANRKLSDRQCTHVAAVALKRQPVEANRAPDDPFDGLDQ